VSDDSRPSDDRPGSMRGGSETASQSEGPVAFNPKLTGVSGSLDTLTFEELVAALERVASRLAGGELGIEAAADLYEQAELLYAAAQERLAAVESRIERLGPPGQA
jgi:exodeoxyribonuclease VII small subunit